MVDKLLGLITENPETVVGLKRMMASFLILFVAYLIVQIITKWLDRTVRKKTLNPKQKTIYPILSRIFKFVVYFIAITMALEIFGVNTTPILAIASAGSVAIGFGAQAVVKDIIAGFFILTENQFNVDDIVKIAEVTGTVEEIGLRITTLRNGVNGELYIVPNGEIRLVTNLTREYMVAVVDFPVPYNHDLNEIITMLEDIVKDYRLGDSTLEFPSVVGVNRYEASAVMVRIACKTRSGQNWAVEYDLRRTLKNELEHRGIHIPVNTRTVHLETEIKNNQ